MPIDKLCENAFIHKFVLELFVWGANGVTSWEVAMQGQEKGNDEDKFKELFKTIQYSWGKGESGNTFFLPDLRGRFLRGVDYNANRDPDKEKRGSDHNGNTGNKIGSIQEDAYKKHYHDLKLGGIAGKDKADR